MPSEINFFFISKMYFLFLYQFYIFVGIEIKIILLKKIVPYLYTLSNSR